MRQKKLKKKQKQALDEEKTKDSILQPKLTAPDQASLELDEEKWDLGQMTTLAIQKDFIDKLFYVS